MSILLDRTNRVLIQGATGQMGTFFVEDARKYGTTIVAGVSPGRDGTTVGGDVPVFGSVRTACEETGADTAIVFVQPAAVLGGAIEAIEAGCRLIVVTADELPVLDTIEIRAAARANGCAFIRWRWISCASTLIACRRMNGAITARGRVTGWKRTRCTKRPTWSKRIPAASSGW